MGKTSIYRAEKYAVGLLSLAAFVMRIPLALRPVPMLTFFPFMDDAYYLFSIARNLATGHPPSIDGVHLTNGFHPLIVLLYIPIFWLCGADSWFAVRWTFILSGIIAALSVWAAAWVMRVLEREPQTKGLTAPIIAAALWTFSYQIFGQMTNGLETGLFSLLLLIAIAQYATILREERGGVEAPISQWVLLGIVLGCTVLARIDAAILVALFVMLLLYKRQRVSAFAIGGMAILLSSPWWVYNWVTFGNLMPSSGQAENSWPLPPFENIVAATKSISEIATLIFYLPGALGWPFRALWTVLLLGAIGFVFFRTRLRETFREFNFAPLVPFLLFSLSLVLYYTFFFRAPHYISRYFQPGRLLWSLVVAAAVSVLWRIKPRLGRPALVLLAVMGIAFMAHGYATEYYPSFKAYDFYHMGQWANRHPSEKIAMLQSGIASFIAPNVINLDGKVNTAALHAHQQGKLAEYLRDEHFTYIADWKPFIKDIDTIAQKNELYFDSVGMVDGIQLMKLRTPSSATP